MGPFFPLIKALLPGYVTTTEQLARAMLNVARRGHDKRVIETRDLEALAR